MKVIKSITLALILGLATVAYASSGAAKTDCCVEGTGCCAAEVCCTAQTSQQ